MQAARGNWFADTTQTQAISPDLAISDKLLKSLAPRAGFEPATIRLTVECSTAELPRNRRNAVRTRAAYNKASEPCKGRNGLFRRGLNKAGKPPAPQRLFPFPVIQQLRLRSSPGAPAALRRHQSSPKKTHFRATLDAAGFRQRGDSMSDMQTDLIRPVPSIVPSDIPAMSDEECLMRLAQAVRQQDSERLDEVARLIGRLAVTIE
jgi:hypothetical protein